MNLDVTEIRPKLYIGSRDAASQTKQLAILGVKHVLSVGTEFPSKLGVPALLEEKHLSKRKVDGRSSGGRMYLQDGGKKDPFVRLFVPIDDMGSVDIAQYFDDVRLFISEGLAQGKVLVHCVEGRSRSVALAVSFLMHKEKISVGKAWPGRETGASRGLCAFADSSAAVCISLLEALLSVKEKQLA